MHCGSDVDFLASGPRYTLADVFAIVFGDLVNVGSDRIWNRCQLRCLQDVLAVGPILLVVGL